MGARSLFALALIGGALGSPQGASALELSLFTRHRGYAESLPENVTLAQLPFGLTSTAARDRQARALAYQFQVVARIAGRPLDVLGFELGLDTGLLALSAQGASADGLPIGERFQETLFLGETFAELQLGEAGVVQIRAGKLLTEIAGGAVYDGYALGLDVDIDPSYLDPELPLRGHLRALLPDATFTAHGKQSPLFELELGGDVEDVATLAAFAAIYVDGEADLAPVLRTSLFAGRVGATCARFPRFIAECGSLLDELDTSGFLGWAGLRADRRTDALRLRAVALLGFGSIHGELPPGPRGRVATIDVELFSVLATVDGQWRLTPQLTVGGFAVVATGDGGIDALIGARYTGFIGLSPRLPLTSIFYGGGLATTLQSPAVSAVAPNGSGIVSGGLDVTLAPWGDRAAFTLAGALMAATHASDTGGFYGVELDARADVELVDRLNLFASGGVFLPGSYYGVARVGGQATLGITLVLGDG